MASEGLACDGRRTVAAADAARGSRHIRHAETGILFDRLLHV